MRRSRGHGTRIREGLKLLRLPGGDKPGLTDSRQRLAHVPCATRLAAFS